MTGTTPGPSDHTAATSDLSDEQRTAIFAAANAAKNRTPSLHAGRITVRPKVVVWSVAVILFLSIGGVLGERYFPTFSAKTPSTSLMKSTPFVSTTTTRTSLNSLPSLQAFMGLKFIGSATAKNISLTSQSMKHWSLAQEKGKVVVLAFYNAICNDICPVVGAEIKAAQRLTKDKSHVLFVVVNTDPQVTKVSSSSPALVIPGISHVPGVTLLSGSISQLNQVWRAYGVKITVGAMAGEVMHNDVLYFIGPTGKVAAYAVPIASVSSSGTYSLDASRLQRFAQGMAETADSLLP